MPTLVKIGERIINLDLLAFAARQEDNGTEVVTLFYERGEKFSMPLGQPAAQGTKDDPIIDPLNMSFRGADARYVWAKLCKTAAVWALPGEIEPGETGGWPAHP